MSLLVNAADTLQSLFEGRSALVLEDKADVAEPLRAALLEAGFAEVALVTTGDEALSLGSSRRFDVMVLDRANPGLDGLDALRGIRDAAGRESSAAAPALVFSQYGSPEDRLTGILAGANDYVPKNVDEPEREVVLRIAAQFAANRRPAPEATARDDWIAYGGFRMSPAAHQLEFEGRRLALVAGLPFQILRTLLEARGVPISHAMLWDRCWTKWKFCPDNFVNIVDTRIRVLRQSIAEQMPEGLRERTSVVANVHLEGFVVRDLSGRLG